MPQSPVCISTQSFLEQIRLLKQAFDTAYALAVSSGSDADVQKAQVLKIELETQMKELEKVIATIEAEHLYDLRSQYESQVTFLKKTGLLETRLETDTEGKEREVLFMKDIHGNTHNLPSYETIVQRFAERKELLRTKADQGFEKLLLVPFGMSLDEMEEILKVYLLAYKKAYDSAHKDDDPPSVFELDESKPLLIENEYGQEDIKGDLVYDPRSFTADHGGITKSEILKQQEDQKDNTTGWRILFVQKGEEGKGIKCIPRHGKGILQGTTILRPDIETGTTDNPMSSQMFLDQQVQNNTNPDSPYQGESGMTPEEWIVAFMINLKETGTLMDNYLNKKDSMAYLTGAYFVSSGGVPCLYWGRNLRRVCLSWYLPGDEYGDSGVRCVVRG